jgi:hypothetical protein
MAWLLSFITGIIFWFIIWWFVSRFIKEHFTEPLNRIAVALERQPLTEQLARQPQQSQVVMAQPITATPATPQSVEGMIGEKQ